MAVATDAKVASLRKEMAAAGVAAYIIPSEDPHMSEYAPAAHERRSYISNFTGSAGTAVVTTEKALLWTDGRYFLQASEELGPDWTLMKAGTQGCPEIAEYLATELPAGAKVGVDPFLSTLSGARKLKAALEAKGKELLPVFAGGNLVDKVWGSDQPKLPETPLRVHSPEWAGETAAEKVARMQTAAKAAGASALLVTALDEVAWLFNLRGSDVDFNPVFVSYAIVSEDGAALYVNEKKITPEVAAYLKDAGVSVKPYEAVLTDLTQLGKAGVKVMADPTKASLALEAAVLEGVAAREPAAKKARANGGGVQAAAPPGQAFVEGDSPVAAAKALKNPVEVQGMREAHLRDGAALAQFFAWLEAEVASGREVSEVEISDVLKGFRAKQPGFFEPSFPTIAGEGPNGAIIHYRPVEGPNNRKVGKNSMLLLDSGGQYDCGTTDITRTTHFGEPTPFQRQAYTAVLKGHIALDLARFPENVPGLALDAFARSALWQLGLNYRHGTGHGVGAALNVHEGPQSISPRWFNTTGLKETMIVSNEPGFYEDGGFGVRIENLALIKNAETEHNFGGDKYLGFEYLTMCPISTKLMDLKLLTKAEVDWVNNYHKAVREAISPRVEGAAKEWLIKNTEPIAV
ncbi:unnamed protein product [Pedinophyceae sp. YPF-701]|nr:unnamed protein product [Pedinophyceae sp. YPF-701]